MRLAGATTKSREIPTACIPFRCFRGASDWNFALGSLLHFCPCTEGFWIIAEVSSSAIMKAAISKAPVLSPAMATIELSPHMASSHSALKASSGIPQRACSDARKTRHLSPPACMAAPRALPVSHSRFHGARLPMPCTRGLLGSLGMVAKNSPHRDRMARSITTHAVYFTDASLSTSQEPVVVYSPGDVKAAQCYLMAVNPDSEVTCIGPHISLDLASVFKGTNRTLPPELANKSLVVPFQLVATQLEPPRIIADALRICAIRAARDLRPGGYLRGASLRREYGDTRALTQENMVWFLSHCQAVRDLRLPEQGFVVDGKAENYSGISILTNEYADQSMYFNCTADSMPYEACWWALQDNPELIMRWPSVQFIGEDIIMEWACFEGKLVDVFGRVTFSRLGHRGGIYRKLESTTVRRNVYAPEPQPCLE
eukprot:jgi/Mesvir1/1191/Mv17684-RA.1